MVALSFHPPSEDRASATGACGLTSRGKWRLCVDAAGYLNTTAYNLAFSHGSRGCRVVAMARKSSAVGPEARSFQKKAGLGRTHWCRRFGGARSKPTPGKKLPATTRQQQGACRAQSSGVNIAHREKRLLPLIRSVAE